MIAERPNAAFRRRGQLLQLTVKSTRLVVNGASVSPTARIYGRALDKPVSLQRRFIAGLVKPSFLVDATLMRYG